MDMIADPGADVARLTQAQKAELDALIMHEVEQVIDASKFSHDRKPQMQ
jgi:hypothetical protein